MTRPFFINELDWKLLREKYTNDKDLEKVIIKIKNDYPVQYLIGNVEFLKNKILVNKHVLIPRFETELLVDKLIKYIKKYDFEKSNMIDVCTGSGAIAIALKNKYPNAEVSAVDKSFLALQTAKKNAKLNNTKIFFKHYDVFKDTTFKESFNILISNPPYVKLDEDVSPNTKYEPKMALFPGEDDIIFYKRILDISKNIMNKRNIIAFEIGSTQATQVCKYAKKIYPDSKIEVEQDYNNIDRFIFIFNNCE